MHTHRNSKDEREKAIKKALTGKEIKKIDATAVNVLRLYFTDGTAVALEVEAVGPSIYGIIACESCAD